tara:strand:+ start:86 stop:1282 length:1197 start_codon:yes stop_codon:yes gene_type:complete
MKSKFLDGLDLKGKIVFLRCDLNVPLDKKGKVLDVTKILRHKITLDELVNKGAKIFLLTHLGRPKGKQNKSLSLNLITEDFAKETNIEAITVLPYCTPETINKIALDMREGTVTFLENIRFYPEEENNNLDFAKKLADAGDYYINDAFSVSHRKHVSTYGLSKYLPSFIGRSLQLELEMLNKISSNINHPLMALIGGSKISTKIKLLLNLIEKVDFLAIGGAMANTFLLAQGKSIGTSIVEKDKIDLANDIMAKAKKNSCELILPEDVVIAKNLSEKNDAKNVDLDNISNEFSIYDIGTKTIENISNKMAMCKTLFWNGPLGVYEHEPFDHSTNEIGRTAAILTRANAIVSVAGGGDTVAALNKKELSGGFTYLSIAGGALVEWLEGKELPGLEFLKN